MSILSQCCGLALLTIILYFYLSRRKILLNTGVDYLELVIVTFSCLVFDMLSVFCINNADSLPKVFVDIICKTYIVGLVIVAMFGLRYVCADVFSMEKAYKKAMYRVFSALLAAIITIYALPIYVAYDENGVGLYTEGPATIATYIFVVLIILHMVLLIEKNRNQVRTSKRRTLYIWIAVWMLCAGIQFFNNEILIVSFGAALGVAIIYLALENPEINIYNKTGYFNEGALSQYAAQHFGKGHSFALIKAKVVSVGKDGRDVMLEQDIESEIFNYISSFEMADLFFYSDTEVAITSENFNYAKDIIELVSERFNYGWGPKKNVIVPIRLFYVPDSMEFDSWADMELALKYNESMTAKDNSAQYVSPEILKQVAREHETEEIIRDAIENNRVEPFYQPIYSIETDRFISAEALARIRREDGTIVPPGVFIPIAEKNGTIIKIGEMMFEKVCALLSRELLVERFDVKYIEINLSTVQCTYDHLADSFISIMNRYHVNPAWINLEITETGAIDKKSTLLKNMNELLLYGVKFSLDDFGTGNSNLNYVIDMPVSTVKFDKGMTDAFFENDKARFLMSSAMKMLMEMGLSIVIEGIETVSQYKEMEKLKATFIQGYYFSKPLMRGDYINFLEMANAERE